jgi:hypothetical protein
LTVATVLANIMTERSVLCFQIVTCVANEMRLIGRARCGGAVRLHFQIWYTYCALLIKPFERGLVLIRLGGADATVDLSGAQATIAS